MNKLPDQVTDVPAAYDTARRPGQPGAENEKRPGPNPRSTHPTGPHAPYEREDPEGLAAEKHRSDAASEAREVADRRQPSGSVRTVDLEKEG